MVEAVERSPHSRPRERGRIRRSLINRMKKGEVLRVRDFKRLLDLGATVEDLPSFTPQTTIARYKEETLFFDKTAEHWDFESPIARIKAEDFIKPQRIKNQTFGWNYGARFEKK